MMKSLKTLLITTLLIVPVTAVMAQQTAKQHQEPLNKLLGQYLNMKKALAQDDFKAAQISLAKFKKEADGYQKMTDAAAAGMKAENIDELRAAFEKVSNSLIKYLEKDGFANLTLYIQYCPMAFNGNGARWVSAKKKIKNPYLGQKMPSCGIVKETIKPDKS